jgi:isoleucyl-tRNA synthetase
LPKAEEQFINEDVERRVAAMRTVIEIVRTLRERKAIPVKYPLKEMVVINRLKLHFFMEFLIIFHKTKQ